MCLKSRIIPVNEAIIIAVVSALLFDKYSIVTTVHKLLSKL